MEDERSMDPSLEVLLQCLWKLYSPILTLSADWTAKKNATDLKKKNHPNFFLYPTFWERGTRFYCHGAQQIRYRLSKGWGHWKPWRSLRKLQKLFDADRWQSKPQCSTFDLFRGRIQWLWDAVGKHLFKVAVWFRPKLDFLDFYFERWGNESKCWCDPNWQTLVLTEMRVDIQAN